MDQQQLNHIAAKLPFGIIMFTITYILLMLTISWLVDFRGMYLPGITEWAGQFEDAPIFWIHIFREAFLTEQLQWLFLGLCIVITALIALATYTSNQPPPWVWILLGIGLLVMLLEDSINLRHSASSYLIFELDFIIHSHRITRSLFDLLFYSLIGIVMVIPFYYIYFRTSISSKGNRYLLIGYLVYGLAAVSSASRHIGDWYAITGEKVLDFLIQGSDVEWSGNSHIFLQYNLGFYFMDHVYEESLELIGASFLLAALLAFYTQLANDPE